MSQHVYLSTACFHSQCGSCRKTCKYCDAPCRCQQAGCDHRAEPGPPVAWVDQARAIARELLAEHLRPRPIREPSIPPALLTRIAEDPALFWLRGEERPPGTWEVP